MFATGLREPPDPGGVRGVTVMRLLALLLAFALAGVARAEPPPATTAPTDTSVLSQVSPFTGLERGDELCVRHETYTCFASAVFDLTFRRDDSLRVTVVLVRSAPAGFKSPRRLATLT